jgi:hypothetical protein
MVIAKGTIIHMNNAKTEGDTASFPSARVCCVAMLITHYLKRSRLRKWLPGREHRTAKFPWEECYLM